MSNVAYAMRFPSDDHARLSGGISGPAPSGCGFEPSPEVTISVGVGSPNTEMMRLPSGAGRGSRPGRVPIGFTCEPLGADVDARAESPARTALKTRPPIQLGRSSHSLVRVSLCSPEPSACTTYASVCFPSRIATNAMYRPSGEPTGNVAPVFFIPSPLRSGVTAVTTGSLRCDHASYDPSYSRTGTPRKRATKYVELA